MAHKAPTHSDYRKFGLFLAALFLLAGLVPMYTRGEARWWAVIVGAVLAVFAAATVAVIALMTSALLGLSALALRASRVRARRRSDVIEARHLGGHHWVAYGWNERP